MDQSNHWLATFAMVRTESLSDLRDHERWDKFGITHYTLMEGAQWCLFE